jgi:hypothetical protein
MKKVKVRIYKDPNGKGEYINKTAKFLKKARGGMQVDDLELEEDILNQLTLTQDVDVIASKLQDDYGLDYFEALDQIENIVDGLFKQGVTETKDEILNQDPDIDQPVVVKPKLYSTDEEWISDDNTGWDDFGEETENTEGASEDDELAMEDAQALSLEKKGGAVNKKKFVKTVVTGLRKAAEGMEQDQSSNSSILDTPIGGRESHINLFRRGMKDLGNEFYAKKIYESTQQLQNQVQNLPPSPMGIPKGQKGFEVQGQDPEDLVHHLGEYGKTVGNIFKTNMNQTHGAGFENIPQARRGREQRQADRQRRQVSKDWQNTFGDIAAGYFGVPGMPNYLQVISPQVVSPQVNAQGAQGPAGPLVDVQFKKGPWWSGKREWSAKGIPAEMLMGMSGNSGRMPGYGYMPSNAWSNSSSWSTSRTSPGEIIRTKSRAINAAADPTKNNTTVNKSGIKPYPGYMELNAAPPGTEMVYDAQGNEIEAISPEEAKRRKASGTSSQYPWMSGVGTNTGVTLNNNPSNSSTADNVAENTSGKSTPGAVLIYPGATDTYLIQMSDGALIQKIGNPRDPKADDPIKGRYTPEQAKGILPKLTSPNPIRDDWFFSGAASIMPGANNKFTSASKTKAFVEFRDDIHRGNVYDGVDSEGDPSMTRWETNRFANRSGGPDNPNTWRMEDKVWSSPYSAEDYDKVAAEYERIQNMGGGWTEANQKKADVYWDANKDIIENESYIITDDQGNEYSANSSLLPYEYSQKLEAIRNMPGNTNLNWVEQNRDLLFKPYAYGGDVSGAIPDAQGNLQRFVYGGNDMGVSPIVSYEDNYINSKNVDDPFMFREGGLYKYDGENNSQVNYTVTNPPAATAPNQYQTPAFNRYNSNATAQSNFAAFNEMKKRGLVTGNYDPTQSYDMSNTNTTTTNTNTNTQNQTQNQGGNYPQGYPTAPPLRDQILEKFMPFKKNQQTGKYYDFMWASQKGPATTLDGKPYQPQGQPGATNQGQPQGQTTTQGQPGTGQPGQPGVRPAGYVYDYEMKKGPWWGGNKQSLKATARWYDPNNPNSGASANAGQFNNGKGPTLDPNAATNTNTSTTTNPNVASQNTNVNIPKNSFLAATDNQGNLKLDPYGNPRGVDNKGRLVEYDNPSRNVQRIEGHDAEGNPIYGKYSDRDRLNDMFEFTGKNMKDFRKQGPALFGENRYGSKEELKQDYENAGFFGKMRQRQQFMKDAAWQPDLSNSVETDKLIKNTNPELAFGGYVPEFVPGGQFSGVGPFDPNDTGIAGGGTGPCTEDQVKNAQPGDPCYNEDYMKSLSPQDFSVEYDINKARTLDFGNIGNIQMGAMQLGTAAGDMKDAMYNENYLASRTDSGNRRPVDYNESHGGYDAQGQRIMAKTQGRGTKGFNRVVGDAAFTRDGGELKYQKGGVYDLTQEEIGKILAAGGQIKFIK